CGLAVSLHPESGKPTATIDLRIDYMRPAKVGERIVAEAEVYRATRTVAFVRAFAHDGDRENPVASATGAFTFSPFAKDAA
ncbi:MAG: PaaI family thioesterase, partial [Amylibacter sp.]|nr:PaaI family thioesterase [Amylibacter sp.]